MHSSLQLRSFLLAGFLASLLAVAPSCSSGGGSGGSNSSTITFALTDAPSDDIESFVVEIENVILTRAAGATVSVLSTALEIDLVSLTDVSQVLNVLNVPPGLYRDATVTIDFTDASCILVGQTVAATILDGDGNPVTGSITFPIEVAGSFSAVANRHQVVELDFDLDRSLEVDTGANSVILEPTFALRVDRTDPKDLALAGELTSVDVVSNMFEMELQTLQGVRITDVTVTTTGAAFQVDGVAYDDADGIQALEAAGTGTWVQCYGAVHPSLKRIDATYVEAGVGTYNGGSDIVEGYVTGRIGGAGNDATLMVLGYGENAAHTSFFFNTTFTVMTNFADTKVLRRGFSDPHDTDDINIGQRVRIFGALSGTMMGADTADSVVRLQPTHVLGYATGPPDAGTVTIDLERVGLRTQDQFMWNEGGTTPTDPNAFTIDVGSLADGLGIDSGVAIEARGLFSAYDDDDQDFSATSLTNRDLAPSLMIVRDRLGGMTLTPSIDSERIELTLEGSLSLGEVARLDRGFIGSSMLPFDPPPSIEPPDTGAYFWSIRNRLTGEIQMHLNYADYADALLIELGRGAVIFDVNAIGTYNPTTNRITAGLMGIVVN